PRRSPFPAPDPPLSRPLNGSAAPNTAHERAGRPDPGPGCAPPRHTGDVEVRRAPPTTLTIRIRPGQRVPVIPGRPPQGTRATPTPPSGPPRPALPAPAAPPHTTTTPPPLPPSPPA